MCSFVGTNKEIKNLKLVNKFTKNRGPDKTSVQNVNGFSLVHNLLSITGEFNTQPLFHKNGDLVCMYNGEIYNYKEFGQYDSDGDCILPLYEAHGKEFVKFLDGEFAIVLLDFNKREIVFVTDTFATKPLWYATEGSAIGFASYESSIKELGFKTVIKMQANQMEVLDLDTLKKKSQSKIVSFDLEQHKRTYDDWVSSFVSSVEKRISGVREKVFIGLSGGYDSGAISCALEQLQAPYRAYTIVGAENLNIINERKQAIQDMVILDITKEQFLGERNYLSTDCEDFYFNGKPAARTDKASAGLSFICREARKDNYKIYLSGQGADEIISDYGYGGRKIYNHSQFGGKFPSDLSTIFPWRSFYTGTQQKYLGKEECVAGSHGVETRYPFLDKQLVQEFLWLHQNLKNAKYKAPIHFFLRKNNYPFTANEKVGFRPNHKFK